MEYKIKLTDNAVRQMQETVAYISRELCVPDIAHRWIKSMKAEIASLNFMPGRVPLVEEEPWRSYGVHKMVVNDFLVYFWIEEEDAVVWITAVVYGRRDQVKVLESIPVV